MAASAFCFTRPVDESRSFSSAGSADRASGPKSESTSGASARISSARSSSSGTTAATDFSGSDRIEDTACSAALRDCRFFALSARNTSGSAGAASFPIRPRARQRLQESVGQSGSPASPIGASIALRGDAQSFRRAARRLSRAPRAFGPREASPSAAELAMVASASESPFARAASTFSGSPGTVPRASIALRRTLRDPSPIAFTRATAAPAAPSPRRWSESAALERTSEQGSLSPLRRAGTTCAESTFARFSAEGSGFAGSGPGGGASPPPGSPGDPGMRERKRASGGPAIFPSARAAFTRRSSSFAEPESAFERSGRASSAAAPIRAREAAARGRCFPSFPASTARHSATDFPS